MIFTRHRKQQSTLNYLAFITTRSSDDKIREKNKDSLMKMIFRRQQTLSDYQPLKQFHVNIIGLQSHLEEAK